MRAVGEVIVAAAGSVASGTAAGRLAPQEEAAAVPTRIRRVEGVRLGGRPRDHGRSQATGRGPLETPQEDKVKAGTGR